MMCRENAACCGAETNTVGDFQECRACEKMVRWDFVDHPFFGFDDGTCDFDDEA